MSLNEQTEAWGAKSITMGEDTRTGDTSEDLNNCGGEAAFAGNHFSRVIGRGSTSFGCNILIPVVAERAFAHGFAAQPSRNTQYCFASGGFTFESCNESLEYATVPANSGHAQTSVLVHRGETTGAANESIWLIFGPSLTGENGIQLEPGKSYAVKTTLIANGVVGGNQATRMIACEAVVRCSTAGVATLIATKDGTSATTDEGDAAAAAWNLTYSIWTGANPEYLMLNFATGGTDAVVRVCTKTEFTEVIFPDAE